MASFEINLTKVKEDLDTLNQYIKNYNETISAVKTTLNNADSFWNDFNTDPFIKTINNDEKNFKNHINALSNYVDVVENFCTDLKQCIFKYMGEAKVIKLKYNSMNLSLAIQDLEKVILFLNNALASLESMNVPLTFKYRIILNLYEKDLKNYIKTLSFSKTTLENINKTINSILSTAKTKNSRIEFRVVDNKKIGYRWQTFSSNLKQIDNQSGKEHNTNASTNSVLIEMLDIDDPVIMPSEDVVSNSLNNKVDDINIQYSHEDINFGQNSLNDQISNSHIYSSNEEKTFVDNYNSMNFSVNNEVENLVERDLNSSVANNSFIQTSSEVDVKNNEMDLNNSNQQFESINYQINTDDKKTNEVDGIENLE